MNRPIVITTLIILMAMIASACKAGGYKEMKDTASFKQKLNSMTSMLKTIETEFVQQKNMAMLNEKIVSKGMFYFKKTNRIRWQYNEPYKYLVIIDNNKVIVKDENKTNKFDVRSNKIFRKVNDLMSDCMQGSILNKRSEYKLEYFENEEYYMVRMFPLTAGMRDFIEKIELYFDKKDLSVSRINMIEPTGDNTLITFKNKKINGAITDEKFLIR